MLEFPRCAKNLCRKCPKSAKPPRVYPRSLSRQQTRLLLNFQLRILPWLNKCKSHELRAQIIHARLTSHQLVYSPQICPAFTARPPPRARRQPERCRRIKEEHPTKLHQIHRRALLRADVSAFEPERPASAASLNMREMDLLKFLGGTFCQSQISCSSSCFSVF